MKFFDRVKETTTTTGTGDITLAGAATGGFITFQSVFAVGDRVPYGIADANGTAWESGYGTLTASTTLERTQVLQSSNSNNAISLSAGTHNVFCGVPGDHMTQTMTLGEILAMATGQAMP